MAAQGEESIFNWRLEDEQQLGDEELEGTDLEDRQEEAKSKGMVAGVANWKKTIEERMRMAGITEDSIIKEAYEGLEKAASATCFVLRREADEDNGEDSNERYHFHKEWADKADNTDFGNKYPVASEYHKSMSKKEDKKWMRGGSGTGLLIGFLPSVGWLVITNNHVVMCDSEAKRTEVYFDYNDYEKDGRWTEDEGARMFEVEELVETSLRTSHDEENPDNVPSSTLDYSLLLLKRETEDDEKFLQDHALRAFDAWDGGIWETKTSILERAMTFLNTEEDKITEFYERNRVTGDKRTVKMSDCKSKDWIFMFSHPGGLAKRLNWDWLPTLETSPVVHINHELGTLPGSSGGVILFSPYRGGMERESFCKYWFPAFLHYRECRAVSLGAIRWHYSTILWDYSMASRKRATREDPEKSDTLKRILDELPERIDEHEVSLVHKLLLGLPLPEQNDATKEKMLTVYYTDPDLNPRLSAT